MAWDNALRVLPVRVVLVAGRGIPNRRVRADDRVVVAWRGHVEIIRTKLSPPGEA